MTNKNPILDELHAVRAQMLADAGGTLAGLAAKIQADQDKSTRKILKLAANDRSNRHPRTGVFDSVDQPRKPAES